MFDFDFHFDFGERPGTGRYSDQVRSGGGPKVL